MMNGKKPYYATIFLQESRFLTPPVICEWLEKLSPVLFGDNAQYEFGHFPDENQTKESYESYR